LKHNKCSSTVLLILYSLFFMLAGCGRDETDSSETESRQSQSIQSARNALLDSYGFNELASAIASPAKVIRLDTKSLRGSFWIGTVRATKLPKTGETIPYQVMALFDTIAAAEGTSKTDWACGVKGGYTAMFSCAMSLPSFAGHPDIVLKSNGYASAAAGRYQFMPFTWDGNLPALGMSVKSAIELWNEEPASESNSGLDSQIAPFGPLAQDMAAALLIKYKVKNGALAWNKISSIGTRSGGVLGDPDFVDFRSALAILAPEWASLPNSRGVSAHGQPVKRAIDLWQVYKQALEIYASEDQQIPQAPAETDGTIIASGQ
jgi:muramidase (phage lysozyme)